MVLLQHLELHFNESWFHGKLKGGRVAAEALLKMVKFVLLTLLWGIDDVIMECDTSHLPRKLTFPTAHRWMERS